MLRGKGRVRRKRRRRRRGGSTRLRALSRELHDAGGLFGSFRLRYEFARRWWDAHGCQDGDDVYRLVFLQQTSTHLQVTQFLSPRLSKVHMPRLRSVLRSAPLPNHHSPTNITLDTELSGISIIMPPPQNPTQIHRPLQNIPIPRLKNLGIKLRRRVRTLVRRIRRTQRNGIVMDPGVHEYASALPALVEPIRA